MALGLGVGEGEAVAIAESVAKGDRHFTITVAGMAGEGT
jgi:hypothetical protein